MPSQSVTARLPSILIEKLEAYIAESGLSKTDIVVAALSQYLGVSTDIPVTEKVAQMENRLARIEALLCLDRLSNYISD